VLILVVVIVIYMPLAMGMIVTMRLMMMVMGVLGRALIEDTELRRRHARPEHALGGHAAVVDGEAPERLAQRVDRQSQIEQRANDHIARRARKAVEVQRLAHRQIVPLSR
jgi:hypothetical protein